MYHRFEGGRNILSKVLKRLIRTQGYGKYEFTSEEVKNWTTLYLLHMKNYLISEQKARVVVSYSQLKENRVVEFKKICDFFAFDFDKARMEKAFHMVTPEAVVNKKLTGWDPGMNKYMLTNDYSNLREQFIDKWGKYITHRAVDEGLQDYI